MRLESSPGPRRPPPPGMLEPPLYSREQAGPPIELAGGPIERVDEVLTPLALRLLASLHRRFDARRRALLAARLEQHRRILAGEPPTPASGSTGRLTAEWRIAPLPPGMRQRRVELTGPPDRKRVINGLNAPVDTFTVDFDDACAPAWGVLVAGQLHLADALRRRIRHDDPLTGRSYRLAQQTAALAVRPRGWHLDEKHVRVTGEPVAAALFDFAVFLANNHGALASRGNAPHFWLAKLESHLEARLWNDVFLAAEDCLGLPVGSIRATVVVGTLGAVLEMDPILFELRDHAAALALDDTALRFSQAQWSALRPGWAPTHSAVSYAREDFVGACARRLLAVCRHRGALAIGALESQLPVRVAPEAHEAARARVRAQAAAAAAAGFDAIVIAHPEWAGELREVFLAAARTRDAATDAPAGDPVPVSLEQLLQTPARAVSEAELRECLATGVQYLEACLRGEGCLALGARRVDAATADLCRARLWHCLQHATPVDGRPFDSARFDRLLAQVLDDIHAGVGAPRLLQGVFPSAVRLFENLCRQDTLADYLTTSAYELM